MAKGFVNGNRKGKVGSEVYYTIKNSNNKVTQGVRIYQPNVTNPQSGQQRAQRMKMQPACNFYRALSSILDHSWEGVKYGAMSRQYFMKQALSRADIDFPFLYKGDKKFVPGSYPISQGSLQSVRYSINATYIRFDGFDVSGAGSTSYQLSKGLLGKYSFLSVGDQVTIVAVYQPDDDTYFSYMPFVHRFILNDDPASEQPEFDNVMTIDDATADGVDLLFDNLPFGGTLQALAVIISRKNVNGGAVWQRSTERLLLSDALLNEWMGPAQYEAALRSYLRTQSDFTSDYYLNDAETPEEVSGGGADANIVTHNSSITFTYGAINKTADALLVTKNFNPIETVAVGTRTADPGPDENNATLTLYKVSGSVISVLESVRGTVAADAVVTASTAFGALQVLTPQQFLAKYSGYTLE